MSLCLITVTSSTIVPLKRVYGQKDMLERGYLKAVYESKKLARLKTKTDQKMQSLQWGSVNGYAKLRLDAE